MNYNINIDSYIGYPITKQWVASQLQAMKGKPCTVRINSYGGDVQTGLDIRQQFIDHGEVTAYIFGMTASAATILAMGAKRIKMSRYALMLIHRCSQWVDTWGSLNAEELAAAIRALKDTQADLETVDGIIVAVYAQRTHQKPADIAKTMQEAKWLTAEQCLELGLIDEIIEEGEAEEVTDSVRHQFAACGLPIPPNDLKALKDLKDLNDPKDLKATKAPKALKALKALLGLEEPETTNNENPKTKEMDTSKFVEIIALLGTALTATADGTCGLTEEQLTALEGKLAAVKQAEGEKQTLAEEKEKLTARVAELEAQVKALKASDGAEDPAIEPETSAELATTASAMFERVKDRL